MSDDYNQIRCIFSNECKEKFSEKYPESLKIFNVANMLVCLQEYELILKDGERNPTSLLSALDQTSRLSQLKLGSKVEVQMQINELQVISFDKFAFKNSQLVDYDENIRIHLNFVIHYL